MKLYLALGTFALCIGLMYGSALMLLSGGKHNTMSTSTAKGEEPLFGMNTLTLENFVLRGQVQDALQQLNRAVYVIGKLEEQIKLYEALAKDPRIPAKVRLKYLPEVKELPDS